MRTITPPPSVRLIGAMAIMSMCFGLAACTGQSGTGATAVQAPQPVHTAAVETHPDHLVNGDFEAYPWPKLSKSSTRDWAIVNPNDGTSSSLGNGYGQTRIDGWDASRFAWRSTQKQGTWWEQKPNAVELQHDLDGNIYAELCAYQAGTALYQDIATRPGAMYKISLKHTSLSKDHVDSMRVLVGPAGHETPVVMTRITSNGNGDKTGVSSTLIATKASNTGEIVSGTEVSSRNHKGQWETYEGTYLIPTGQTVTRFTFESVSGKALNHGNLLDDISFQLAYPLTYQGNGSTRGNTPRQQQ